MRRFLLFCLALGLLILPLTVEAQRLHFGTNLVVPGQVLHFSARLNAQGWLEASQAGASVSPAKGAFVAPATLTNLLRPCPLLILSVPSGGSAIGWMPNVTSTALEKGWAVLAADGPKVNVNDDTIQFGWGMLSSVLEQFTRTWPQAKQWPVACGGFSGGAKRSAAVGAAMAHDGWRVIGVFMGGCNEDRATLGLQLFYPGDAYKRVPFFLSNGTSDPIANPQQAAAVAASMRQTGFSTLRLETYEGGHRPSNEQLDLALSWFAVTAGLRLPRK